MVPMPLRLPYRSTLFLALALVLVALGAPAQGQEVAAKAAKDGTQDPDPSRAHATIPQQPGAGGRGCGRQRRRLRFQDVYYADSADGGRSVAKNIRITDRIIDRNIGVWSNNSHIHANVGIASGPDTVYFAWQDTRNGNATTNTEDIYFASVNSTATRP